MTVPPPAKRPKPRKCAMGSLRAWLRTTILIMPIWNAHLLNLFMEDEELDPSSKISKIPVINTMSNNSSLHHFHQCIPTHHACDDYRGVLHIECGDFGGAGGTIFFQFIVAQLIYAEEHRLLPFIHMDNFSHLVYDEAVHNTNNVVYFQATF